MTRHRRQHWYRRRAVRTIAQDIYALASKPARERLAVLISLAEEAHNNMYAAMHSHNYAACQEWRSRYHWLDNKRRETQRTLSLKSKKELGVF